MIDVDFDAIEIIAQEAIKSANKTEFAEAMLAIEMYIDVFGLGRRYLVTEQDLLYSALDSGLFSNVEEINKLVDDRKNRTESYSKFINESKRLYVDITKAIKEGDYFKYDTLIDGLTEMKKYIPKTEKGLVINALDYLLFTIIDEASSKSVDIDRIRSKDVKGKRKYADKVKKLVEKGIGLDEAEDIVAEKELKKRGMIKCEECGEYIDTKYSDYRVFEGKHYHERCYIEMENRKSDELSKIPFEVQGVKVKCAWCKEQIYRNEGRTFVCPEGEDFTTSLLCKWYHRRPKNCYEEYLKNK